MKRFSERKKSLYIRHHTLNMGYRSKDVKVKLILFLP